MKITTPTRRFLEAYCHSPKAPFDFVIEYRDSSTELKEKLHWLGWGGNTNLEDLAVLCTRCAFHLIEELEPSALKRRDRLTICTTLRSMRHRIVTRRGRIWLDIALMRLGSRRAGKVIARDYNLADSPQMMCIPYQLYAVGTRWAHAALMQIARTANPAARSLPAFLAVYAGCAAAIELLVAETRPSRRQVMRFNAGIAPACRRFSRRRFS